LPFIIILVGLLGGVLFYSGTVASYKKAGAGQTYRIESSTDVKLTRRIDNRAGTRSRVDHGFYSGSVSPSGRSEAYPMPDSIKHTIQMAKEREKMGAGQSVRPPQPKPSSRPRPPMGPMSRPGGNPRRGK